jgi:hypothetical protein
MITISPSYYFWKSPYGIEFAMQAVSLVLLAVIARRLRK